MGWCLQSVWEMCKECVGRYVSMECVGRCVRCVGRCVGSVWERCEKYA